MIAGQRNTINADILVITIGYTPQVKNRLYVFD